MICSFSFCALLFDSLLYYNNTWQVLGEADAEGTTQRWFVYGNYNGSLKIQYNRNRYYDYYTGRWLTHDPLGITPNPQLPNVFVPAAQYINAMNLYEYLGSNPMADSDPFGLFSWGAVLDWAAMRATNLARTTLNMIWQKTISVVCGEGHSVGATLIDMGSGDVTTNSFTCSCSIGYEWSTLSEEDCKTNWWATPTTTFDHDEKLPPPIIGSFAEISIARTSDALSSGADVRVEVAPSSIPPDVLLKGTAHAFAEARMNVWEPLCCCRCATAKARCDCSVEVESSTAKAAGAAAVVAVWAVGPSASSVLKVLTKILENITKYGVPKPKYVPVTG